MSTIDVKPKVTGSVEKVREQEVKTSSAAAPDKSHHVRDQEMMYAWSIGVTSIGRGLEGPRRHQEYCPPEVYIG